MSKELNRRDFVKTAAAMAAVAGGADGTAAEVVNAAPPQPTHKKTAGWPFYVFDNGLRTVRGLADKCKLVKDLGYVGIEYHLNHAELPRMLDQLDKHGLELNAVYTVPSLESPMDPKLPASIKRMKGRDTRIEMAIRSGEFKKPSDPRGDPKAAALLKSLSDACADSGPVVSIYPHTWFWTERVEDGVRLAKRVGRKNVGTNFNLVHWKWVKNTRPLETILREALPHLFSVTINGLQSNPKGGRDRIVSLDQGDYDLYAFMALVRKVGYTGPVGLQCYSVTGPSKDHLKRSMRKWRDILKRLAEADRRA
jgi:sugar phosphate isomerase/epimerase